MPRVPTTQAGRRRRNGERGESLIEFAFASMMFFASIFAVLEFGQVIWRYNLVSNLAQEGARYAAVHGLNSGSPMSEAQIGTYVTSRSIGMAVTVTTPGGAPNTILPGNMVEVRVVHNLSIGGGILPLWSFPMQSTGRMMITR